MPADRRRLGGIGLATSYTPIEAAIHAFRSGLGELIIGADPLAPEHLYQKLFALTWPVSYTHLTLPTIYSV